jgi:hypothetical protein
VRARRKRQAGTEPAAAGGVLLSVVMWRVPFFCRPHGRFVFVLLALATAGPAGAQALYEQEPINYLTAPADDPVARLQKRISSGEVKLERNDRNGYLDSVLRQLDIPVTSQSLVFSKTSFQRDHISPANPRALYFDDETYVGWVPGADVLEIAATDPVLGPVFYTIDQHQPTNAKAPAFVRQTHSCLQCHGGTMTRDTPGLLVRSVFPDASGQPVLSAGTFLTTQQSPWSQRWGGWYVTGTHGAQRHMGNSVVTNEAEPDKSLNRDAGANVTDLSTRFDTGAFPTPHSDIVALLVLEHQAEMHNLLTRASYQARLALRDQQAMNRALGRPDAYPSDSTKARIESAGEALVRCMLFADEPVFTDEVAGTSTFAEDFEAKGPKDAMGRSLRDLDLKRRLFRYPCSYLIYSASFDALPAEMKDYVYKRLWQVLNEDDEEAGPYSRLKRSQRRAILQILAETKKDLPDYWKP